ncbi:MAG: tetratricopeptide repeat protein [Spartobacteria bacterium]
MSRHCAAFPIGTTRLDAAVSLTMMGIVAGRAPDARMKFAPVFVCIALAALVWSVFGQTRHYGFINYDDGIYVYENPIVTSGLTPTGVHWAFTHPHAGNWHPVTTLSHMLDCQLFGLNAGAHHCVNVLLQILSALLLFVVLRNMTSAMWPSAFVAAIFAIHPLRVESVAWIAERKDLLSGIFFFCTLGAYHRYVKRPSLARYVAMSILFAVGLMSKSMLVTTPLVFLLLDYWPLERMNDLRAFRRRMVEKIPLLFLSLAAGVATIVAQRDSITTRDQLPLIERVGNAFVSAALYIWEMFWPTKLAVFYPYPQTGINWLAVVLCGAVILTVTVFAIRVRKTRPYFVTGWFWYLVMLLPVVGLVQVGLQAHADRYTYLPQIGLSVALTWLVVDLVRTFHIPTFIPAMVAGLLLFSLGLRAAQQTSFWRDSETLWRHTLKVTSANDVAHANLADLYLRQGRAKEAIASAEKSLTIRPGNADAENNLGLALRQTGDVGSAVLHWEKALAANPHQFNSEFHLAWVRATSPAALMRNGSRAVEMMEDVVARTGVRSVMILRTLAASYAEAGRFSDAIATAQEALQLASRQSDTGMAEDLRLNISDFEANLPLRDPSLSHDPTSP